MQIAQCLLPVTGKAAIALDLLEQEMPEVGPCQTTTVTYLMTEDISKRQLDASGGVKTCV